MIPLVELLNIDAQGDLFDLSAASATPCNALRAGAVVSRVGAAGERSTGHAQTQAALQRRAA